jgi:hypothetical protein
MIEFEYHLIYIYKMYTSNVKHNFVRFAHSEMFLKTKVLHNLKW